MTFIDIKITERTGCMFLIIITTICIAITMCHISNDLNLSKKNEWSVHTCYGIEQTIQSFDCYKVKYFLNLYKPYLSTCYFSNLTFILTNAPSYGNLSLVYQCEYNDDKCIVSRYLGHIPCYMKSHDIKTITVFGIPSIYDKVFIMLLMMVLILIILTLHYMKDYQGKNEHDNYIIYYARYN